VKRKDGIPNDAYRQAHPDPAERPDEIEKQRLANAARSRRLEDGRLRFGPLRGDVRR
jgi:hypothetical protein